MVQFGKTLNEVVKSDWRCHAVAYMELKRALSDGTNNNDNNNFNVNNNDGGPGRPPVVVSATVVVVVDDDRRDDDGVVDDGQAGGDGDGGGGGGAIDDDGDGPVAAETDVDRLTASAAPAPSPTPTPAALLPTSSGGKCGGERYYYRNNNDADSVHTESSYRIGEAQKASFFRIYDDSVDRLATFYDKKVAWADGEREEMEKLVARCIAVVDGGADADDEEEEEEEEEEGKEKNGNTKPNNDADGDDGDYVNDNDNDMDNTNEYDGSQRDRGNGRGEGSSPPPLPPSASALLRRAADFSRDLGLVLEFLELNATAFSKIMKKYDKRTGSNLREGKLRKLRLRHPYLYDGGVLRGCKECCAGWMEELQQKLSEGEEEEGGDSSGAAAGGGTTGRGRTSTVGSSDGEKDDDEDAGEGEDAHRRRRSPSRRVSLTHGNSLTFGIGGGENDDDEDAEEGEEAVVGPAAAAAGGDAHADATTCENPQESDEAPTPAVGAAVDAVPNDAEDGDGAPAAREEAAVRALNDGGGGRRNDRRRGAAAATKMKVAAPKSIHKTKDTRVLQHMINRVEEELCLQKVDSPFFDNNTNGVSGEGGQQRQMKQPPSFTSSEVELAGALGQGEFCKIYEVRAFNVPESCHICFLHRGFKDAELSPEPSPPVCTAVPSSVIATDAPADAPRNDGDDMPVPADERQPPPSNVNRASITTEGANSGGSRPLQNRMSSFAFNYDPDISDYDELESDHEDDDVGFSDYNTRGFMKDHCLRDGEARYAIKRIRSSLVGEEEITDAAIDLAREAQFLAALKHPNIIRIRGTINIPGHPKYSLILDRLYDTLEVQMQKWKADVKLHRGKFKGLIGRNKRVLNQNMTERLIALYDLSRAMAYLHDRMILHRDIKPANIGFDIRGDIKIFDFGLAKELKPCDKEGEDQYHTSGMAGTRKYMAPEVAQVLPYGLSADVYSFAILMWEMLSLKSAFSKHSREKHYKEVIVEGKRPKLSKSWPFALRNLLQRCWHNDPSQRPTFQAASQLIKFGLPDISLDEVNLSDRSIEILSKSERTIRGRTSGNRIPPIVDSDHRDDTGHGSQLPKDDSVTQSIRIKNPRVNPNNRDGDRTVATGALAKE